MLNAEQKATLKAYILADPVLSLIATGPGTDRQAIAIALSADASPVTKAWRVAVPSDEVDEATPWAGFDSVVAGKRDSWGYFLKYSRNFTKAKVRKWVTDVWGNATASSDAESILNGCALENAKRVEVVLGGTTRATGTVSALDRNYVGAVTIDDIASLWQ